MGSLRNTLMALALMGALTAISSAQTVSVVYNFTGKNQSQYPLNVTPAQGRDGKLYGTAFGTGANVLGSIFALTTAGQARTIFLFDGTDGEGASSGLILATDGNFYGTTADGGSLGYGVLYRVTPAGDYAVLHNFASGIDGALPEANPIEASDGNLYGTTLAESPNDTISTVYKYEIESGTFTTIYQFNKDSYDGAYVRAPLVQGLDGNLYGTAESGGIRGTGLSCGTIFELSTSGTLLSVYRFDCRNGSGNPYGPLVQASDGNFYGTTSFGSRGFQYGQIFKMDQSGNVSFLYTFPGRGDGASPEAGVVQATDGSLYGVTTFDGSTGNGVIFQITLNGVFTPIYSMTKKTGTFTSGSLMQHTNGLIYGAAETGGKFDLGTVYSLDMGLGPFITFVLPSGSVGQSVQILGQGLTGTTSVTFNGVPATSFHVDVDTSMTAVVPPGATTGPVVVTTPTGALTSNKNFVVR